MAEYATPTKVRRRKTSLGHWCYVDGCHKSAYVEVVWKFRFGVRLPTRYCLTHAKAHGL